MHWLSHWLGLDNASGSLYLFWSGIVGDFSELAIVGALFAIVRKHQCEVHGCWRIGKHATDAGHSVCRRHHPESPLTPATVRAMHERAGRRK